MAMPDAYFVHPVARDEANPPAGWCADSRSAAWNGDGTAWNAVRVMAGGAVNVLRELECAFAAGDDVWRVGPRRLLVANPEAARDVLGNRAGEYLDTSDFFFTRRRVFGPRPAQIAIGRLGRDLLQRHVDARRAELPGLVRERLRDSTWPDAGNLLVYEHLRDVLLRPDAPAAVHAVVDGIVRRAVLAGARERHSRLARLAFRRRATRVIEREARSRRAEAEPSDLLGAVVAGGGPHAAPPELAEVYLSFLFATVGSIGFALGWSALLAGTHPDTAADEPGWIVREALRLWPVAWLFERRQRTGDVVEVCTYLVQRHPRYWKRANEFVPRRWASPGRAPAYLPFGYGPHTCAGAAVTMSLLEDLVRILTRDWHPVVTNAGAEPHLGPALAPPRFHLELRTRERR
jgi:hypothetical protein